MRDTYYGVKNGWKFVWRAIESRACRAHIAGVESGNGSRGCFSRSNVTGVESHESSGGRFNREQVACVEYGVGGVSNKSRPTNRCYSSMVVCFRTDLSGHDSSTMVIVIILLLYRYHNISISLIQDIRILTGISVMVTDRVLEAARPRFIASTSLRRSHFMCMV